MLFLLNPHISEPLEASTLKTVRINSRNLSRICVKADPWGIPTCSLLHGMVLRISTIQNIFMKCHLEVESPLSRSTLLTPRTRRHFRSGDLRLSSSTLTAVTLRKERFSVYWNSSDRAFSVKEQSSVLPSALRKTSMNFRRTRIQLGILTLNLGHINRIPYIGGCSKFPKWVRTDINHRALPHLVFRNAGPYCVLVRGFRRIRRNCRSQRTCRRVWDDRHGSSPQQFNRSPLQFFSVAHMMPAYLLNFYVIIRLRQAIKAALFGFCMAPFFAFAMA